MSSYPELWGGKKESHRFANDKIHGKAVIQITEGHTVQYDSGCHGGEYSGRQTIAGGLFHEF